MSLRGFYFLIYCYELWSDREKSADWPQKMRFWMILKGKIYNAADTWSDAKTAYGIHSKSWMQTNATELCNWNSELKINKYSLFLNSRFVKPSIHSRNFKRVGLKISIFNPLNLSDPESIFIKIFKINFLELF